MSNDYGDLVTTTHFGAAARVARHLDGAIRLNFRRDGDVINMPNFLPDQATALARAMLPDGWVAIPADRLARLVAVARAADAETDFEWARTGNPVNTFVPTDLHQAVVAAVAALQLGDLDGEPPARSGEES